MDYEVKADSLSAAFDGAVFAGVVYQNAAHQLRGDAEKLGAVLPIGARLVYEFEIGFIDECGGLQGMATAFAAQVSGGDALQFGINQRHEPVERSSLTATPGPQHFGDIFKRQIHLCSPLRFVIGSVV